VYNTREDVMGVERAIGLAVGVIVLLILVFVLLRVAGAA
jgi:tetrahydromethanopterin S-methyltransferase subunit F